MLPIFGLKHQKDLIPGRFLIDHLLGLLNQNDIIIDGGNSNYKDTKERGIKVAGHGMHYLDCGTSGGLWGLENGYSLMTGGNKEATDYVYPIYQALAPVGGYTYCGESGAGHFVKMVHNGIEYGMMQSLAEGMEIIEKAPYNIDLNAVAKGWQQGSVVRSWLLDLLVLALNKDQHVVRIAGFTGRRPQSFGRFTGYSKSLIATVSTNAVHVAAINHVQEVLSSPSTHLIS